MCQQRLVDGLFLFEGNEAYLCSDLHEFELKKCLLENKSPIFLCDGGWLYQLFCIGLDIELGYPKLVLSIFLLDDRLFKFYSGALGAIHRLHGVY